MSATTYTRNETRQYVMRRDSIAPCWNKDILTLKELFPDLDAWCVGTVPCRLIRIVGMVVGAEEWCNDDNIRVIHHIDDGTRVAEVVESFRWGRRPLSFDSSRKGKQVERPGPLQKRYQTGLSSSKDLLKPKIYKVGDVLRVVGKVRRSSRQVEPELIEQICDLNEEHEHWKEVAHLHKTHYSRPFIIPPAPVPPKQSPITPQRIRTLPDFANASPLESLASSSVAFSSPGISSHNDTEDGLSHPSLIRSRDLTSKTFGYYIKFYMAHEHQNSSDSLNGTPTKENPRGSPVGYNLQYLRRAPDLRYLARRIVIAEARKREREKRQKDREQLRETQLNAPSDPRNLSRSFKSTLGTASPYSNSSSSFKPLTAKSISSKMKRLFQVTIRNLFAEGEIVLVQGSGKRWTTATPEDIDPALTSTSSLQPHPLNKFRVWEDPPEKAPSDSSRSRRANTSVTSKNSSASRRSALNEDEAPLDEDPSSDYDPDEDAYLPLTPELLAGPVKRAIRNASLRTTKKPNGGASLAEIIKILHTDETWARVGEWSIKECLKMLVREEEIWERVKDSWLLL